MNIEFLFVNNKLIVNLAHATGIAEQHFEQRRVAILLNVKDIDDCPAHVKQRNTRNNVTCAATYTAVEAAWPAATICETRVHLQKRLGDTRATGRAHEEHTLVAALLGVAAAIQEA